MLYLSYPYLLPGILLGPGRRSRRQRDAIRDLALTLENDLNGKSLVGALWSITCNDAASHPSASATVALARSLAKRYPLGAPKRSRNILVGCLGWTGSPNAVAHLSPTQAPTPLVIGNVYDPEPPYVSAQQLAAAIGGRLVT